MKILFVGQCDNPNSAERPLIRELRKQHDVVTFDYLNPYYIFGKDICRLPGIGEWMKDIINSDLLYFVGRHRPDAVVVAKGHYIYPETIKQITEISRTLYWMPDDPQKFDEISHKLAYPFDAVITSSRDCIPMYRAMGIKDVRYMPFFCDPEIHRKTEVSDDDRQRWSADVIFAGQYYSERAKIIEAIQETGFSIKIWGTGWRKNFKAGDNTQIGDRITQENLIKAFNSCKIALNIHHVQSRFGGMVSNARTYESTGCGAFTLCDRTDGIEDLFDIDKEIVCYNDAEDAAEKVKYFLWHGYERQKVAQAGQRRAYREHTVRNRAEIIAELLFYLKYSIITKA